MSFETVTGIVYLLVILTILVVAHELGHYWGAKWMKMRVEDFSVFFGKPLFQLRRPGGETFTLRRWPLGGFVKVAGMEPDDISGGKPILEALRSEGHSTESEMNAILERLNADTMAGIDAGAVSSDVRAGLMAAIDAQGRLTQDGREWIDAKLHSPQITQDDHKLLELVKNAQERADDPGLYCNHPVGRRAVVIFAGPLASLLFGLMLFCLMGMTLGLQTGETTNQVLVLPEYKLEAARTQTPARRAGLQTGDRIVAVDGHATPAGKDLINRINDAPGKLLRLSVDRNGQRLEVTLVPDTFKNPKFGPGKPKTEKDRPVKEFIGRIGVVTNAKYERVDPATAIVRGTLFSAAYVEVLIRTLLSRSAGDEVGGILAMGQMSTAKQRLGLAHMVELMATFSLGLGIMNLLPIPILDGGHLLLLTVEKLRRRKLSPREVYRAQMVGLGLLLLIVTFVTYNDISKFFSGRSFQ